MEFPVKDSQQVHDEASTAMDSTAQESSRNEDHATISKTNPQSAVPIIETLPRPQKRKVLKKVKRKQRRQQAAKEAKLHTVDVSPEQEDEEAAEKERLEHELQLKLWLEREKYAQEEAERKRKEDEERKKIEDEEWEYVEDGPAEIIWEGNEITVRKQKVKVRKGSAVQSADACKKDDALLPNPSPTADSIKEHERPVSNPLPPQSAEFRDWKKSSHTNVLASIEQTPNFGTEQDKTHCPFHIKTGVCRFGVNCSRVHVYPDTSCTILIKNMYNGPGLALEYDEGLEYTDEEIAQHYEEFYEDVHGEFQRYGEVVNFKVCRNESAHLRGNVYVQFESIDSAIAAYNALNGRFYAGKQITCEFVAVTRWRVALCGEYMRSHHRTCSHGMACNFLHCFRNPQGEYDWADWDNPRPKTPHQRRRSSNTELDNERRNRDEYRRHRHSSGERRHSRSQRSNHERERRYEYGESDEDSSITHRKSSSKRKDQSRERRYQYTDSDENTGEEKTTHRISSSKRKDKDREHRYEYTDSDENSIEEKKAQQRSKRRKNHSHHYERERRYEHYQSLVNKPGSDQNRKHRERWHGNGGSDEDSYEDNQSIGMQESKSKKNSRDQHKSDDEDLYDVNAHKDRRPRRKHHENKRSSAWDSTVEKDKGDINERQKSKNKEKYGHNEDRNRKHERSCRDQGRNSQKSKDYRKRCEEESMRSPSRIE